MSCLPKALNNFRFPRIARQAILFLVIILEFAGKQPQCGREAFLQISLTTLEVDQWDWRLSGRPSDDNNRWRPVLIHSHHPTKATNDKCYPPNDVRAIIKCLWGLLIFESLFQDVGDNPMDHNQVVLDMTSMVMIWMHMLKKMLVIHYTS